jgi:hypothetical protein
VQSLKIGKRTVPLKIAYPVGILLFTAFLLTGNALIDADIVSNYYAKVLMLLQSTSFLQCRSMSQPVTLDSYRLGTPDLWRSEHIPLRY